MGEIRKQSIFSSALIYLGFVFGFINTILFARKGYFTTEETGLIQLIIGLGLISYSFSSLGVTAIISRYYPYYYDGLKKKDNDLLGFSIMVAIAGFVLLCVVMWLAEPIFVRKFSGKSPLFIKYYYVMLPYTFFLLMYTILETHAFVNKKSILPNFLREGVFRLYTTVIILLFMLKVISYKQFVFIFSFNYSALCIIILIYLRRQGLLHFTFKTSEVTRHHLKSMAKFLGTVYVGNLVIIIAQNFDVLSLSSAGTLGLTSAAIYGISKYMATLVQVPQRGMIGIAIPFVTQAWKDNNFTEIKRIYNRSALNLLIIAMFLFFNLWLNLPDIYATLRINPTYLNGLPVFLVLGITYIIELGTGVNGHMLFVSPAWRFEFGLGLVTFFIFIPLNYFLIKHYDIMGAACATAIIVTLQNVVRVIFIWYRFKMLPFTREYWIAIICALINYGATWLLFHSLDGWTGMIVKSTFFSALMILEVYFFKLSPDALALVDSLQKRIKR